MLVRHDQAVQSFRFIVMVAYTAHAGRKSSGRHLGWRAWASAIRKATCRCRLASATWLKVAGPRIRYTAMLDECMHYLPTAEREHALALVTTLRAQYSLPAVIRILGYAHNSVVGERYCRSDDRRNPRENGTPA
jgi:hypothetical protein